MESRKKRMLRSAEWILFALILLVYPLRHIRRGVDLWDGGYNYANFRYSGLTFMDSMWYFATWAANGVGSLFSALPFGDTCIGMNVYTGLVISAMSITAFFFCVRKLKMPAWMVFIAEIVAMSMCWAPSAMLYSYLTYAFLLAGTIFLYLGLWRDKNSYLIVAGVILGLNVGNRFSNLVQTGLILAVWLYGILEKKKFRRVLQQTGFCVLGYVGALAVFLGIMAVKYGLSDYVEGILRLFQMTEHADDYTPGRMLLGMVWAYYDCTYFLKRLAVALAVALLACVILPKSWQIAKKIMTVLAMAGLCVWLINNRFYSQDYAAYTSVYYPCVTVLTLTLCLSFYQLVDKQAQKENKLLGILLILTILITSLGGNNAIYSSINNLFLVLPGFFWMVWCLWREKKHILAFPFQCILLVPVLFLTVQSIPFGQGFVYEEAAGGRNLTAVVEEVPVLRGMKTSPEKAAALTQLYQYLQQNHLGDKKCILYGQIPGIAYYMELEPALNIWSDLRSYDYKVMEQDLNRVEDRPLIILTAECAGYVTDGNGEGLFWDSTAEDKMKLLCTYIEENGYELTYTNEKFAVYE